MLTAARAASAALVLLAAATSVAVADEVYLKSGGQLSGRVVSRTAERVEVDVGAGRISVPASSVLRIEEGRSALQEYEERAGQLAAGDVEGWVALAQWAEGRGLGTQASEAYHRALAADPGHPGANQGVGNVLLDGRWVSEDESYRARGYLRFEGEWITPAEHEAILRQREAEEARERQQRSAEAQQREADARAAEAEVVAGAGIPLWYGWGGGPAAWPVRPGVVPPPPPATAPGPAPRPKPVPRPRPVPR